MSESPSNGMSPETLQKVRDQVQDSYPDQKTPALDGMIVTSILEDIRKIPANYRDGYGKQEVEEDGTPMVDVGTYGLKGENVYGKYAKTTPEELITGKKLDGILKYSGEGLSGADINPLKFDVFSVLEVTEKIDVVGKLAGSMGFEIEKESMNMKNVTDVRDVLILAHNNSRLRELGMSMNVEVRKDVAERLSIANRHLHSLGFNVGVSNGLRSSEIQRTIKENHEYFRGKGEAEKLFASEDASPHLSGGAVDVYLIKDGKRVDLKLRDNSPETKSPLYSKDATSPKEQEIVKLRQVLLDAMNRAGFVVNPTEYWHFSYGDKMWAYVKEVTTGKPTTAMYDAKK